MKLATGLTLIAIGAILTFAISAHPRFLNLQVVGLVLMATGAAGLLLPRRAQGWLRRRMVVRRGPRGPVISEVDETLPPYISLNPGASADGHEQPGIPVERTVIIPTAAADPTVADQIIERRNHADRRQPTGSEVVDEYFEE
jgi:hypothetical protein